MKGEGGARKRGGDGGRWETAQMLACRPDLVDLSALNCQHDAAGIIGADPKTAKKEDAEAVVERALGIWESWVKEPDIRAIERFYARRIKAVSDYLEEYAALSWEQAIKSWWEKVR